MTRVAAVDIGTNSTNLLVLGSDGLREFHTTDTRLGQGVDAARRLDADAVERTLTALRRYRDLTSDCTRVVAVATSAVRDAADRDAFLDRAAEALGVRPVVIDGATEGRWAFRGAVADLGAAPAPRLVLDIGGGSTEFTVGTDEPAATMSVDVGSVRLTEQLLHHDPPRADELSNAIGVVNDHLDDVLREIPQVLDVATVVGIGGTITTVAAVELGAMDLTRIHGLRLPRPAVEDVFRTLATEALADRVHNPGLPRSRAAVIVGGACILVAVLRRLQADELVVSHRTLLDAVCTDLLAGGTGVAP